MYANVLIFSESRVEAGLFGLDGYLQAQFGIDGPDFRQHWHALVEWHRERIDHKPRSQSLASFLGGLLEDLPADRVLTVPGYVTFLASAPSWDSEQLWSPQQVEIWEELLPRLKVFEQFNGLRSVTIRVRRFDDRLVCPATEVERMGAGHDNLYLPPTLRPLDFTTPWVVDPGVARSGLVYDIIHFTRIVTSMRDTGAASEEAAFRAFFKLQRRLDRIAADHRLYREKYLGDGVFYTGRDSRRLLVAAIRMQRNYRETVRGGFPFDRGMRLALNHGSYRLLPFGEPGDRRGESYEIFGETVVELFRLISGKSSQDLRELQSLLVSRGYEEAEVRRFFAPLMSKVSPLPALPFSAHLTPSGQLMNSGIVATNTVIEDLQIHSDVEHFRQMTLGPREYVIVALEDAGEVVEVGMRRLGRSDLKGLESPMVIEIVDVELFEGATISRLEAESLSDTLGVVGEAAAV
ncbi:MAG: hypothetical protein VYE73_06880 [Acidobacteriota bacterium]|nr:hypothetical protein [Acidobacteriota bacterium]